MFKRGFCVLLAVGLLAGCGRAKPEYAPSATNDHVFAVIGLDSDAASSQAGSVPEESASDAPVPEASAPELDSGAVPPPKSGPLLAARGDPPEISAVPETASYPVGTGTVTLIVSNNGAQALQYTTVFDLRRQSAEGEWLPLDGAVPADGTEELLLPAGESVAVEAVLNPVPAEPGRYRLAQLACFADARGSALACTGIEAEFELTAS